VQGTRKIPYKIDVKINPITKKKWINIKNKCKGKIHSVQELLDGKMPEELSSLLIDLNEGLFPKSEEIQFTCTCPDGVNLCKHIAAVLYGVGSKLDNDSQLFFTLRGVTVNDLVTEVVEATRRELMEKTSNNSRRFIDDADVSRLFGISMQQVSVPKEQTKDRKKKTKKET